MSNTPSELPLGTTFAKLCSGVSFLIGAVVSWQNYEDEDFLFEYSEWGLIAGSICLLVSILVMEAFGPIKRNLYRIFFHIIGGICIMIATFSPTLMQFEKWNEFVLEYEYFTPWCWIIGGLLLALCQVHLIYCFRSRGYLTIVTFLLAMLGSILFMIVGILQTRPALGASIIAILFASVLYILHALMYPFACNKMNQQEQDDSGTSTPDVYQQFPIRTNQPLNNNDENKDVAAV